jgi:hypothetical protein
MRSAFDAQKSPKNHAFSLRAVSTTDSQSLLKIPDRDLFKAAAMRPWHPRVVFASAGNS